MLSFKVFSSRFGAVKWNASLNQIKNYRICYIFRISNEQQQKWKISRDLFGLVCNFVKFFGYDINKIECDEKSIAINTVGWCARNVCCCIVRSNGAQEMILQPKKGLMAVFRRCWRCSWNLIHAPRRRRTKEKWISMQTYSHNGANL